MSPMVAISPENTPPQWQIWCLTNCMLPCCPFAKLVPSNLEDTLTENQAAQQRLDANPLFYDQSLPLCTGHNLLQTTLSVQQRTSELRMPILICHGDKDCVTDCEHSRMFIKDCGCNEGDKTLKIYEGCGHLLYEEDPNVFADSVEWMMQRISKGQQNGDADDIIQESVSSDAPLLNEEK